MTSVCLSTTGQETEYGCLGVSLMESSTGADTRPTPMEDSGSTGTGTADDGTTDAQTSTGSGSSSGGSGSGSGSSSGGSGESSGTGGDGTTTGMALHNDAPATDVRTQVLEELLSRGVLPADVAQRLKRPQ